MLNLDRLKTLKGHLVLAKLIVILKQLTKYVESILILRCVLIHLDILFLSYFLYNDIRFNGYAYFQESEPMSKLKEADSQVGSCSVMNTPKGSNAKENDFVDLEEDQRSLVEEFSSTISKKRAKRALKLEK